MRHATKDTPGIKLRIAFPVAIAALVVGSVTGAVLERGTGDTGANASSSAGDHLDDAASRSSVRTPQDVAPEPSPSATTSPTERTTPTAKPTSTPSRTPSSRGRTTAEASDADRAPGDRSGASTGSATQPSSSGASGKAAAGSGGGGDAGAGSSPSAPATGASPRVAAKAAPGDPADDAVVDALLDQLNSLRADHGLQPLKLDPGLRRSAHAHNLAMSNQCGLSHRCSGEGDLGPRISAQGVTWRSLGENISTTGQKDDTDAVKLDTAKGMTLLMYNEVPPDDGHRRNILSDGFTHVGIDVIVDDQKRVWLTQDFRS